MANAQILSVVVPVFNQSHLTERCLESLLRHSEQARELVVVDNHSTDRTPELLLAFKERFEAAGWTMRILRNEENTGFGRACNRGIRDSSGENIAILNNDTWLMPSWDTVLLKRLRELKAAMVAPYLVETPFHESATPELIRRFTARNRGRKVCEFVAVLMVFPRQVLEDVGLFDERYFVTYEDADLRERMDRAGKPYFQVGDCAVWHHSKGTRESGQLPSGYEQEGLRLFLEKWGFDPRAREHTRLGRLRRRMKKIRNGLGYL